MQLIFVCSGNTCRSPLATAAWQVVLRESDPEQRAILERVAVSSAGLNARVGAPVTAMAGRVAATWQVDLSEHRARQWQPAPVEWLVPMTAEQVGQIRFALDTRLAPEERMTPQVRALGSFEPRGDRTTWPWPLWERRGHGSLAQGAETDVLDPFGGSLEAYQECGERILRGVRALARAIVQAR